jgi:hypothetical protein
LIILMARNAAEHFHSSLHYIAGGVLSLSKHTLSKRGWRYFDIELAHGMTSMELWQASSWQSTLDLGISTVSTI